MAKILVTGATGFVGKRLIYSLLEQGHTVYALVRIAGTVIEKHNFNTLFLCSGDIRDPDTIQKLPKDIDAAYYLMHSMSEIARSLEDIEKEVAKSFVSFINSTDAKQIIYLGGIINDEQELSSHLKSRLLVEEILKSSKAACTILRASIIVGAGSASFEIIRDLCEKLPVMIAPKWLESPCQPIAIQDVLFYLTASLLNPDCYNKTFDIGGPDVFTFKQLLLEYSKYRGLKRYIINVPVLTPRLSSLWLVFITSVRFSLCFYLVESIKTSSICMNKEIEALIPHKNLPFIKAVELAFQSIAQNEVVSTWMDSWEVQGIKPSIQNFIEVPKEGCLSDVQRVSIDGSTEEAISRIWSIGGSQGYFSLDWAWKLRGLLDKLVGGVGLNRGRRHPIEIEVGDSIDFWRVLRADKKRAQLILYAEMKLPGEAWLEFKINNSVLIQTATFRPKGIFGRLYWWSMFPFHYIIFRKMAQRLANG